MMDNEEEKSKNVFVEAFEDCVGGEIPFVSFLLLIGIIQCLGWFYQLLTYSNASKSNLLWLADIDFLAGLPFIILAPLLLCLFGSILYAFIYFVILTIYLIKIPFKK